MSINGDGNAILARRMTRPVNFALEDRTDSPTLPRQYMEFRFLTGNIFSSQMARRN